MNFKIKFWDTERKIMLESNISCVTAFRNYLDVAAEPRFSDCNNQPEKNRYIPLLFTGAMDINNKEIWEDDTVLFDIEEIKNEAVFQSSIKCRIIYDVQQACFCLKPFELSDFDGYPLFAIGNSLEKIGNIYEHI